MMGQDLQDLDSVYVHPSSAKCAYRYSSVDRGAQASLQGPIYTHSWFVVRDKQSSNQDITEGLVNGFNDSTSLGPGKVHQATDTIQGRTQCAAEFTLTLCEAHRMRALQKGTLEKVAESLVPAFPAGNIPHICTLATASMMGTWPDQAQYLGQPLLSPWFIVKQALVLHSRPAPHPVGLVRSLWVELAHLEPTEAQGEEPPPELKRTPEPEEGPAPGLEPGPAVVVLEPSGPPALIRIPTAEPAPPPTTDYPRAGTPKHLIREEKVNILTFPPRLVAEQLTAMDVELFKKVLPHQCLGSVWSQRRKPGKEHVASTVSATVRQCNHVATCVITTCLGDSSMMAQDRAKVVAHWMKVAKKQPSGYATLMFHVPGSKPRLPKKCVPFLGEYLKDHMVMDTRMENDLEVQRVLEEIVVLQEAAQKYKIEPEEQFQAWLWHLKWLSETESYIRSCQLKPQS
uniref:Ras-GEF domain-containing protein n=1 Tax=Myotis myotis TaxID=51298 RepID=A0A7J7QZT9_MYOMY|nr:hypothetical protein mMyoMyo1_011249 [Myotis myotis]